MFLFPGPVCSIIYSVTVYSLVDVDVLYVCAGNSGLACICACERLCRKMHEGTWFVYGSVRVSM